MKNKCNIQLMVGLFDWLYRETYFAKLDLRSRHWQVRIAEGDKPKTAYRRYRSYKFLVIPFGLTNVPKTFYNLMNDIIHDYLDKFVMA